MCVCVSVCVCVCVVEILTCKRLLCIAVTPVSPTHIHLAMPVVYETFYNSLLFPISDYIVSSFINTNKFYETYLPKYSHFRKKT